MAKDYSDNIATAQRLITEFGRAVTLVQFATTPADPSKPWDGPADARATPESTLAIDAVFVPPSAGLGKVTVTDDLINRSDQICIVSPGATADLTIYEEIIDTDGTRWKIDLVDTLKPANDVVLGYLGVSR